MSDKDIETYLMINEPAFYVDEKQYSVCCIDGIFGTWDSDGNTFDFHSVSDLLDHWIIGGRPFREIIETIM